MTPYLIKMIFCSGLFLSFYILLLEKEKMYRFNRVYLLGSILLSLVIPSISIELDSAGPSLSQPVYTIANSGNKLNTILENSSENLIVSRTRPDPVFILYCVVTTFLLVRFARNLFLLFKEIKRGEQLPYGDVKLVLTGTAHLPYSFFHYIFVNRRDYQEQLVEKEILHHELAHVRQNHSADILFAELLLCFTWFNPFSYAYKRAIRLNHEFLADDAVVKFFKNTVSYQNLLLNKAYCSSYSILSSPFNFLITKKRLIMMTQTSSTSRIVTKKVLVIGLTAALIIFFGAKLVAGAPLKTFVPTKETQKQNQDTVPPPAMVGITIGSTREGVSTELLKEYQALVDKYKSNKNSGKEQGTFNPEDRARMEAIFKQMNPEQQKHQEIIFLTVPGPLPKIVPAKDQFNSFKNASIYGVWIDDKKVSNEALNRYQNTSFSQIFISRLYGAAKKGRTYTHQVNLMTNEYYNQYYQKTLAKKNTAIMLVKETSNTAPDK